jgi:hypothetical protein
MIREAGNLIWQVFREPTFFPLLLDIFPLISLMSNDILGVWSSSSTFSSSKQTQLLARPFPTSSSNYIQD